MKDVWMWGLGLAIALVAGLFFMQDNFAPFKANQSVVAQTNQQALNTLNTELNTAGTTKGSVIINLMNGNAGRSGVEIIVDSSNWDGKAAASSSLSISPNDDYIQSVTVSGSTTIYTFTKIG